jgi:hypothetical protein
MRTYILLGERPELSVAGTRSKKFGVEVRDTQSRTLP